MEIMKKYFNKFMTKEKTPLKVNLEDSFIGLIGGFITIAILALLTKDAKAIWLIAPFGASCVLVFGVWNAPLSQPRNVIGGHIISSFIGIMIYKLMGNTPVAIGLGVGLAIAIMILTKTTHPPAGADPIVTIMAGSSFGFLFKPVLLGAIVIVILGLIINNISKVRKYPTFWL
ncbi:MAG: HPP family protein [Sarcina sp.]